MRTLPCVCVDRRNYGPTIYPQQLAAKQGFTQVLWLSGSAEDPIIGGTAAWSLPLVASFAGPGFSVTLHVLKLPYS